MRSLLVVAGLAAVITFGIGASDWAAIYEIRIYRDPIFYFSWSYILAVIGLVFQILTGAVSFIDGYVVKTQIMELAEKSRRYSLDRRNNNNNDKQFVEVRTSLL